VDNVKFLPGPALPASGAAVWPLPEAERWRAARLPAVFAPVPAGWILLPVVLAASLLLAWAQPAQTPSGTVWDGYAATVLLFCVPWWYRFLPGAAAVAAPLVCLQAVVDLAVLWPGDTPGRVGDGLVIGLSLYVFAGAVVRLRCRRGQREIALAVAGETRAELPPRLPAAHRRRGLRRILTGSALCLGAAALLAWGLAADLAAQDGPRPYDAFGQQFCALVLLVPGSTLLGRGVTARRAARRLHRGPQPVLRIGLRDSGPVSSGRCWLLPDARTTTAGPLIACRRRYDDVVPEVRTLLGGTEERLRVAHHDINPYVEPFEALLYGVPAEGAEVVLEWAVFGPTGSTLVTEVTAAVLWQPASGGYLGSWEPAGTSYRLEARAEEARRRTERQSSGSSGSSGSSSSSSGAGGCGSSCSSCGSGCGGCGGGG
jgi:uncharacterized membrane protein YgcG